MYCAVSLIGLIAKGKMDEIETKVTELQVRMSVVERLMSELEARIALQLGRILADIESEKGTRKRLHEDWLKLLEGLQSRVRVIERNISIGIGIIAALQVIIPIAVHVFKP